MIRNCILVFVVALVLPLVALNKDMGEITHRKVIVNSDTSYIVANILLFSDSYIKKLNDNVVYTWYKRNSIKSTKGNYSGELLDGIFILYDLSGNMKVKGNYAQGLMDGKWYYWSKKGILLKTVNYKEGLLNGVLVQYNHMGAIVYSIDYKLGVYNGYYTKYKSGIKISESEFKNGQMRKAKLFRDGLLFKKIFYDKNGQIRKEKYYENKEADTNSDESSGTKDGVNKTSEISSFKKFWNNLFNKDKKNSEETQRI